MNESTKPKQQSFMLILFFFSYLALLANAFTFAPALKTVSPGFYLYLAWAGIGLVLGLPWAWALRGKTFSGKSAWMSFLGLACLQGGLAFVIAYFFFQTGLKGALAYPAGALMGFFCFLLLSCGASARLNGLLLAGLLAAGFAISLRLQGIPGGLSFGLAFLNLFGLGSVLLGESVEQKSLWQQSALWLALLVVGRATIQQYLVESGYLNLGVVITHPYTYAALFAGLFLPALFWVAREEKLLPSYALVILLGILFPLVLGTYLHVRPTAGFLLGLVSATFLLGMLVKESLSLLVFAYAAMATVWFGLPLFKLLNNLSRLVRLEVLGGVFVLSLLGYWLAEKFRRHEQN